MENLKNETRYGDLIINNVIFSNVKVYIWKTKVELIDSWGRVVAQIKKEDIDTVNF